MLADVRALALRAMATSRPKAGPIAWEAVALARSMTPEGIILGFFELPTAMHVAIITHSTLVWEQVCVRRVRLHVSHAPPPTRGRT